MGGGDEWEVGESSGRKAQLDKGGVRPGELTWAELLISFGERGSNCSSVTDLVMTLMKQGCEREPTEYGRDEDRGPESVPLSVLCGHDTWSLKV